MSFADFEVSGIADLRNDFGMARKPNQEECRERSMIWPLASSPFRKAGA
jgi:hypothetical protein